ncbi:MAG TPA: alpha/beta fold hydrolase [Thermoanaerobaculia bacterium]|nr:alpha/beta fold hydrolase [Thermoanaerobaculia bacterium]
MPAGLTPIELAGPAGRLEAILKVPLFPRLAAVVAHPHPLYGGTMHNKVVFAAARRLEERGAAVLRFNFRGVGKSEGRHDQGRGERQDMAAALAEMRRRLPGLTLISAGYSFGCFIALAAGADGTADRLLALSPPVDHYDFSFLQASSVPLAVVSGEDDPLAPALELTRLTRGWAGLVHWEVLPGTGHDLAEHRELLHPALDRAIVKLLK